MSAPSSRRRALHGLYLILDSHASRTRPLVEVLKEAASAGARIFQFRDKTSSPLELYRQATHLRDVAAGVGALFLVNDRCDLALAVDADGVHLGQEDLPLSLARALLGPGKLIGISAHRAEQVKEATRGGADYLGFGPIFQTASKPDHEPVVGLAGLREIRALTPLPVFAIGGVSTGTVQQIVAAGADGVAVISTIMDTADIAGTVRAFMAHLP
ncbi:MAG: thiamine phosphate synthase [Nitrospiraceae bacterium]